MRAWFGMFVAVGLLAQETPPGAVQGTLLERDEAPAGLMTVRAGDNYVHIYRFDDRTYFERYGRPASAAGLRSGDLLEIVSEPGRAPGRAPGQRYARSVLLVEARQPPPRRPAVRRRSALAEDLLAPRGNLTFAGMVAQLTEDMVVLRTRTHGDARIVLRQDTRFIGDGLRVMPSLLQVNMRVFIRGARNLDGDIEAYQVMWGRILKPPPSGGPVN